ncbi:hypothetical protein GCM10009789_15600 [Kribbella sancticallisti]|uniref:TrbL/VirB6 plasmid conjugal transfer protein n=1 Tax=Kribbella sancticallisti TaxID=460087 RepID=A0ABP4NKS8_9ACTN
MCGPVDVGCQITEGFQAVISNGFDELSRQLANGALDSLHSLSTFWIDLKAPTLATGSGEDWANSGTVGFLQDNILQVSAAIFTVAVLIAGIRIAWEQRAEPLQQLLKATMLFIVVSAAGTATLQLLVGWSDEFALHIVQQAVPSGQTFDSAMSDLAMGGDAENAAARALPILLAMFSSVLVFVAAAIQVVLLLIRSAMLVLLAGTFPLAAAATNTEVGKVWFKKYCGWALAFIAYKPAAALIYAAAFRMNAEGVNGQSGNTLVQVLTGLMMLALAILALPALLRFAVPITAAVAGGSSAMGSAVADPGGIASGAINVARSRTGGGSSGSGGGSGGSGGGSAGGGGGGSSASGAIGAAAGAGLAAAGAGVTAAKKASNALAGAATHSAGEGGGGTPTSSSSSRGPMSRPSSRSTPAPSKPTPQPVGPSGSN